MRIVAMIMAGGQGKRLGVLSQLRAKPAVPFAGKYRIIDFTLSNCVNSGISTVGILTQYLPRSLTDHIRSGSPWDLDRMNSGAFALHPYQTRTGGVQEYKGTADAIYQNLDFIKDYKPQYVLILAGDHIYKMDYNILIDFHEQNNAEVTIATRKVPIEEASRFGILEIDEKNRVMSFEEKPAEPKGTQASMGIYVFNYETLVRMLVEDAKDPQSKKDFGGDIIPKMVRNQQPVFAFPHGDYWVDVGTLDAYWETHMGLLEDNPELNLLDREWIVHTRSEERPPVNIRTGAVVNHSLITDGCVIEGSVEYSVLSPGVKVGRGAIVRRSIVLTDAEIEPGAVVDHAIIDKRVRVGRDAYVGQGNDRSPNNKIGLSRGITVIGKNTVIPPRMLIGRNVQVGSDLSLNDFDTDIIKSGSNFKVDGSNRR
jgi:glucose-1-phosphate adenylyltransferase